MAKQFGRGSRKYLMGWSPCCAGVPRRWGRFHFANGACPPPCDGIAGAATRHEASRLYWDEIQATHHGGETARCARCRWHAKQVEQRGGANGFLLAHGGFYLVAPRVFVVRLQLGTGLCQFSKERHSFFSERAFRSRFRRTICHKF
jgi:hypothetical protein